MNPLESKASTRVASAPEPRQEVAVIPVVQEELHIEKQAQSQRMVVEIVPQTRTENVDVSLANEHIEVERVPVNRSVEQPVPVRQEGDVTIVSVMEEVLVVERRLRVKEEIRLIRRREVRHEQQEVQLHVEEARVREKTGERLEK